MLYQDCNADPKARARDLVSRMTLEEKVNQMNDGAPAIPRLGVPEYHWWNECLHGVGRAGRATVFPQSIGMAATWNPDLIFDVASAISDEARAKHHAALKLGSHRMYMGLTYWSPTINILRDPRWGRGQETYGEDPYLTSRLGVSFIKGLQGNDPKYLKLVGTAKHFAAHSGPEEGRASFNTIVGEKDLAETYLPAFEALVKEGGSVSVMSAYNRVNGEASSASPTLLQNILRNKWGFEGYVVSDCGAIESLVHHHKLAKDMPEAAAMAVKAGLDLCCGNAFSHLKEAKERGLIEESEIDQALVRLFEARFRLGMFDPEEKVPYASIPVSVVDSPQHRELARRTARESIVLLKNNGVLPLKKDIHNILVTGPNAASIDVLLGNYNGYSSQMVTLLEGIVGKVDEGARVISYPGCQLSGPETKHFGPAGWEAPQADVIIACLGLSPLLEGEEGDSALSDGGGDRLGVELPPSQQSLLKFLVETGHPVIVVLTGGSPITIPYAVEHAAAILEVWYPGEEGGNAVADVLFGDYNPAGRLPVTFPSEEQKLPPIEDYSMDGRTYRFCKDKPQFPFGFGLSYTTFEYRDLQVEVGEKITVKTKVANTGNRDGEEVVQVYLTDVEASVRVPIQQLVGFKRVPIQAGCEAEIEFVLDRNSLCVITEEGERVFEPGEFVIRVGGDCQSGLAKTVFAP